MNGRAAFRRDCRSHRSRWISVEFTPRFVVTLLARVEFRPCQEEVHVSGCSPWHAEAKADPYWLSRIPDPARIEKLAHTALC